MTIPIRLIRIAARTCAITFFLLVQLVTWAAEIHGTVTDASGAKVPGAKVLLVRSGKPVSSAVSGPDGSFQVITGASGPLLPRHLSARLPTA